MKTYAPNYYKDFHCIADACRHSCCIGWDVYIDEATLERYESMGGALGKEIAESIAHTEDGACFRMREDGHCPFLDGRGLCRIILEKGEGCISEICTEHPRFYNFFSDRTEAGLGLCCEESARLILSQEGKTELCVLCEDGEEEEPLWEEEAYILEKRARIFALLQERKVGIEHAARQMLCESGAVFPQKSAAEWAEILSGMEILDAEWRKALSLLARAVPSEEMPELENAFEKLLLYFVYRHAPQAIGSEDMAARICFAYLAFEVIRTLCAAKKAESGECTFADLCEFCRAYSAEIEYSEENTEALLRLFREQNSKG